MCGRYASVLPPELIARMFGAVNAVPSAAPTWNLAPSQTAMLIRRHPETGDRFCQLSRQATPREQFSKAWGRFRAAKQETLPENSKLNCSARLLWRES
jgi:putative SOS response-associated peptidase YedK